MDDYLKKLMTYGASFAFFQVLFDGGLTHPSTSPKGRAKLHAALIGFASR